MAVPRLFIFSVQLFTVFDALLIVSEPIIGPAEYSCVVQGASLYGFPESCCYEFLACLAISPSFLSLAL